VGPPGRELVRPRALRTDLLPIRVTGRAAGSARRGRRPGRKPSTTDPILARSRGSVMRYASGLCPLVRFRVVSLVCRAAQMNVVREIQARTSGLVASFLPRRYDLFRAENQREGGMVVPRWENLVARAIRAVGIHFRRRTGIQSHRRRCAVHILAVIPIPNQVRANTRPRTHGRQARGSRISAGFRGFRVLFSSHPQQYAACRARSRAVARGFCRAPMISLPPMPHMFQFTIPAVRFLCLHAAACHLGGVSPWT
jgi:hypothetical protein